MRQFILYLLVLGPIISYTQEKKIEIDFKSPKSAMSMYDTYSFVNKERNRVCILAIGNTVIRGYILDENYTLVREFSGDKPAFKQVLVGGYFSGDKVHFLLGKNTSDDDIMHYTLDSDSILNAPVAVDLDIKRSMFMGGLSLGDQFLFVSVKKKEDKIMVYRFGKKETHEVLQFDYPGSALDRERLFFAFSKEAALARDSEVSYISDWESPSLDKSKDYCKMYYRNDSLIITIDREINKLYVLELDLAAERITGRQIARGFDLCTLGFQSSSFLLNDHLYSVVACHEALQLIVYNFYTGKEVRQYRTKKEEDIMYSHSDILQAGSYYFSGDKKLEKTRQLLRKMANGRAVIIAKNTVDAGVVELTIGSYQEVSQGTPTMWGGATGAVFMSNWGFSREWIKSARFKSLLARDNFEKASGEIQKPVEERIEAFTKDVKIPDGCEGLYPVKGGLAYYYLDRKEGKLVVSAL